MKSTLFISAVISATLAGSVCFADSAPTSVKLQKSMGLKVNPDAYPTKRPVFQGGKYIIGTITKPSNEAYDSGATPVFKSGQVITAKFEDKGGKTTALNLPQASNLALCNSINISTGRYPVDGSSCASTNGAGKTVVTGKGNIPYCVIINGSGGC
jgi:hypothetical protein